MVPQLPTSEPPVRRGFSTAIVLGCLALLTSLMNPVTGVFMAAVFFAIAWGIRRRQAWAAIAGSILLLMPLLSIARAGSQESVGLVALAVDLLIGAVFLYMLARAAVSLWRDPGARHPAALWLTMIAILGGAGLFVKPYVMSTGSMEPTLLTGDYVLFNTLTWKLGHTPRFAEVVMLRYPPDPKQTFTKRIVGLPGDRLHIANKQLFRNGAAVSEPYAVHQSSFVDAYRDNFPSSPPTTQLANFGTDMLQNHVQNGEVLVPPGKYFVLGDNRDNSLDSRYWGFISREDILGSPLFIYGSSDMGGDQPGIKIPSIFHTRWSRLLRPV